MAKDDGGIDWDVIVIFAVLASAFFLQIYGRYRADERSHQWQAIATECAEKLAERAKD